MATVTWVINGNSKHEISSVNHLLQLMNQGTLFTNAGSTPTGWLDGTENYEQTVDIDLDGQTVIPIGIGGASNRFEGDYDGANFSISNWNCTGDYATYGLFAVCRNNTVENVVLKGVWTTGTDSTNTSTGFLTGSTSGSGCTLRNCHGIFDAGSGHAGTPTQFGGLVGEISASQAYNLSISGTITNMNGGSTSSNVGGIVGRSSHGTLRGLKNSAIFPNGITGFRVGGIMGSDNEFGTNTISFFSNNMVGDIIATHSAGGIMGQFEGTGSSFSTMVNSMRGDITGTNYAGGLIGNSFSNNCSPTDCMNYMTGDIISTNNTSAGIIGHASISGTVTISNCVIAMFGAADEAVAGTTADSATYSVVSCKLDLSFGYSPVTTTHGSTGHVFTGTTDANFTDLDYIPLSFTDNAANTYEHEMVFGCVGGKAAFSAYTHAVLSKDDITGPLSVDFDLTANTTVYLTYLNTDSLSGAGEVFTDGSLTVLDSSAQIVYEYAGVIILFGSLPSSLTFTVGALNASVVIDVISGVVSHRLTRRTATSSDIIVVDNFTVLTQNITNLSPETLYTIGLYTSTDGSTYTFSEEKDITTLANSSANYTVADFDDGSGGFDLSGFNDDSLALLSDVMDSLFTNGDSISLKISGIVRDTTFVKIGSTVTVPKVETEPIVSIGFSGASTQTASLELTDDADVTTTYGVNYDGVVSSPSYTINGVTYQVGDSFILNGKKVTITEF